MSNPSTNFGGICYNSFLFRFNAFWKGVITLFYFALFRLFKAIITPFKKALLRPSSVTHG